MFHYNGTFSIDVIQDLTYAVTQPVIYKQHGGRNGKFRQKMRPIFHQHNNAEQDNMTKSEMLTPKVHPGLGGLCPTCTEFANNLPSVVVFSLILSWQLLSM